MQPNDLATQREMDAELVNNLAPKALTPPERQPAYDAVYDVIRQYPVAGLDGAMENARVWRAVVAALDAMEPVWLAAGRKQAAAAIREQQRQTRSGTVVDDALDLAARIAEGGEPGGQ